MDTLKRTETNFNCEAIHYLLYFMVEITKEKHDTYSYCRR